MVQDVQNERNNYNPVLSLETVRNQWAHNSTIEILWYNVFTINAVLHNLGSSTPLQNIKIPVESADVFGVF